MPNGACRMLQQPDNLLWTLCLKHSGCSCQFRGDNDGVVFFIVFVSWYVFEELRSFVVESVWGNQSTLGSQMMVVVNGGVFLDTKTSACEERVSVRL